MKKPKIISLWSGPRNVSTALMYSFAQRIDTTVVDEPLYAYYLRVSGADHPGRDEVLASMDDEPSRIWKDIVSTQSENLFIKNMAHHAIDLNEEWYDEAVPVLLIRDPVEMLPSLQIQIPEPTLRDTALARQYELLKMFIEKGKNPIVIDSRRLLMNLRPMLRRICADLDIPFDNNMLQWKAGPRKEDGIWAKYWYQRVHTSTGFEPYQEKKAPFPENLRPLLKECTPYYTELLKYAIND